MAQNLIPSNATIKAIKDGDPRRRLSDGAGLYLRLFVNGGSHGWRLRLQLRRRAQYAEPGNLPEDRP